MAHAHAARERRGDAPRRERQPDEPGERGGRGGGAHYLEDVRTSASQMRRPAEGSSLSWRSVSQQLCFVSYDSTSTKWACGLTWSGHLSQVYEAIL